jgi:hypothetical protein
VSLGRKRVYLQGIEVLARRPAATSKFAERGSSVAQYLRLQAFKDSRQFRKR